MMRVLHLVGGELKYGAARGAYWLHEGLIELGVDSYILTDAFETDRTRGVYTISTDKIKKFQKLMRSFTDRLPLYLYKNREKTIYSTGLIGYDFTKTDLYKQADIIHLHWINGGFVSIRTLARVNKPIVWTLRDMWPITGGCHYSMGCERFKDGCGKCFQLGSNSEYDISKLIILLKKKYFPTDKINLVGISNWITQMAKESILFRDSENIITTIHNCVNTKVFKPVPKILARKILNIPKNKKVISYGSINLGDVYKSYSKFIEAIGQIDKKKYFLLLFGKADPKTYESIKNLGFEHIYLGFLNDDFSLKLVYSSSDVFVSTSLYEAFGKTIAEAMSCGTPVVCFDATGPKDIVDHKINGYKAVPFDPKEISYGIEWICNNQKYKELSENARNKVLKHFDCLVIAKKYLELYESILNKYKHRR